MFDMDFLDLAKKRYSCREYKPDKVKKEDLMKILEAGRVSPSAHNNQPYKLLVIQEQENLEKVRKAGRVYNAPLIIIVCGDTEAAWENSFNAQRSTDTDAAIITDHMMLTATDLGLNTLWMAWFDREMIRKDFALPPNLEPINLLLVGYGEKEPKSPDRHAETRKPLEELAFFEGL